MRNSSTRRQFLSTVGGTVAGLGLLPATEPFRSIGESATSNSQAFGGSSLRDHAAAEGLLYGTAAGQGNLSRDSSFAQLVAQQCGILVPEGELKWLDLRPSPDAYDFTRADWLLAFAQQHDIKFRGHTLVWYQALPKWFYSYANASNAKQLLLDHIRKVVGRYAGKIESWDVINEVMNPKDNRPDGLRNSLWLQFLGPDYLEMAFRAAASADPHAILTWNENWLEEETPEGESKRNSMLKILKDMKARDVPIRAIGIQSHLVGDHADIIAGPGFQRFLHEVSDMDLNIMITELDVSDQNLPADVGIRDQAVADLYYKYLSTVLIHKSVLAVLTWGLSDKYTWLSGYQPRPDKLPVRPLPYDADLKPTAAWSAIARALDEAPKR
jgi:endo-1,4-beta-xylanase